MDRSPPEISRILHSHLEGADEAEGLHIRGVGGLIHPGRDLSAAVEELEQAAEIRPEEARIQSDLAIAYSLRAFEQEEPHDLVRALARSERAVALDPNLEAASFNRSLLRTWLSLKTMAEEAWSEYLEVDTVSPWAGEARRHLARLRRAGHQERWQELKASLVSTKDRPASADGTISTFRQELRELAEDEVLTRWAGAYLAGEPERAAAELETARRIEEMLERVGGGNLLRAASVAIEAESTAPARLERLATGLARYGTGLELVGQGRFELARPELEAAHRTLREAGSPFAHRAAIQLMRCAYQASDYERVRSLGAEIVDGAERAKFPSLHGRVYWILGTTFFAQGRHSKALRSFRLAEEAFEEAGEPAHRASILLMAGSLLDELGDLRGAWSYRYEALRVLGMLGERQQLRLLLNAAIASALDQGEVQAALVFQQESLAAARETEDPMILAPAYRLQAALHRRLGDRERALSDIVRAKQVTAEISDPAVRESVYADVLAEEGRILLGREPGLARAPLDEALAISQRRKHLDLLAPELHHTRALSFLASNDLEAAEAELRQSIELLEAQRREVSKTEHRIGFFDLAQGPYERLIEILIARGEHEAALDLSERARARALLDLFRGPGSPDIEDRAPDVKPLSWLLPELPPETPVVVYEMLPAELGIWVVAGGEVRFAKAPIAPRQLVDEVRGLQAFITGGRPEAKAGLARLYDLLILPARPLLGDAEKVVLVPDGPLARLPFAALLDSRTGRYLLEDRALVIAPSLNLHARLARLPPRPSPAGCLVVADPASDPDYPMLGTLAGAREEGEQIARLYSRPWLLVGAEATRQSFLGALGEYPVVHFAGHAVDNARNPFLSSLVLAPEGEAPGALPARDLLAHDLGETQLVVLSACKTAGESPSASEAMAGLVWPFLARGVPSVVASLWPVDDQSTARLMVGFHQRILAGESPHQALRASQLELLGSSNVPGQGGYDWAVFQIFGS